MKIRINMNLSQICDWFFYHKAGKLFQACFLQVTLVSTEQTFTWMVGSVQKLECEWILKCVYVINWDKLTFTSNLENCEMFGNRASSTDNIPENHVAYLLPTDAFCRAIWK